MWGKLKGRGEMTTLQLLIHRLTQRGIPVDHIPVLVRNVLQIIGDGGFFTSQLVNAKLEKQGWPPGLLDETNFQLIVFILETEWGYRVRHYDVNHLDMDSHPSELNANLLRDLRATKAVAV